MADRPVRPGIPWLDALRATLEIEFADRPPVAVLATVDAQGGPDARCVIVRRIDDDGRVWVASDAASGKNEQLHTDPRAALVFWLPGRREQYRLRGPAEVRDRGSDREQVWAGLSPASRALFVWPEPGRPLGPGVDPAAFARDVPDAAPLPERFTLIAPEPTCVEHLELNHHPHRRRRWMASDGWCERHLTP